MATVYIKPGTGTGTGTASDPYFYSQLSSAETAAGAGGTILFTDGTYSLTSANWLVDDLTYKSLNQNGAVIDGTVTSEGDGPRQLLYGSTTGTVGTVVDGFSFIDFRIGLRAPSGGIPLNKVLNCNLTCTQFLAFGTSGVITGYWATNRVLVSGCSFYMKWYSGNRIFSDFANGDLEGCTLGLDIHPSETAISNDNLKSAKNCIFTSNDSGSVLTASIGAKGNTCCFYNWGTTTSGGTNNIFQDPQLVNLTGGDLRLRPTSPCIGAATLS